MEQKKSIFEKLRKALTPTRESIFKNILGRGVVSEKELDELEESLILSDVGVNATSNLMGFL
ncbi:MAG: signal recognition particle receptor subunit alpha, partial [bacterium]|nr:signal recognition particle receptor subunit alpha [bacterium]